MTHFANATGHDGEKLNHCPKSVVLPLEESEKLKLDPAFFKGGIAIWGALKPVYTTRSHEVISGVHVHAREIAGKNSPKIIDNTYKQVELEVGADLFGPRWETITEAAAVAYFNTLAAGHTPKSIRCSKCDRLHLDEGAFSVIPHRKHQCQYCGRDFMCEELGIGNPIASIKEFFNDEEYERAVTRSSEEFEGTQSQFKGGIEIWASNPAAFWTQPWPESEGIHFHGYDDSGRRVVDETFGKFSIDGITFNKECMRIYMAQIQVYGASGYVCSVRCTQADCNAPHFDVGENAFKPHVEHICSSCGTSNNVGGKKTIGNPIVDQLTKLRKVFDGEEL